MKAITQSKFEFFETFAVNFKKAIFDLITTSKDKKYLNKYIFKIIEKCVAKLNNIEKELLYKLNKISQNIVDIFLKQLNLKIKKLFRSSMRSAETKTKTHTEKAQCEVNPMLVHGDS